MDAAGTVTEPTVSIVVPTFRRPDALSDTLTALLDLDYPCARYEVIVVDDGADEATSRVVSRLANRGVGLTLDRQYRRGAACARNRGARVAGGEWVLFCDDDIVVPRAHLRGHVAAHRRHEEAVVAGAWELAPGLLAVLQTTPFGRYRIELERRFQYAARGEPLDGDPSRVRTPMVSAADLSLRRDLFTAIGGFDEHFPLAGAEDQDLSLRARAVGALLVIDTELRCYHHDHYLSVRAYCYRNERSARTLPFLVRKHAAKFKDAPLARENRPIEAGDPPRLVTKKLLKAVLSRRLILELLHRLTQMSESAHAPERLLRRLYGTLLALHTFRGFRRSWRQ